MLNNGEGVEINKKEVAFFFKKAADNGMPFAADKWKIIEFPKRMNDKKKCLLYH